MASFRHSLGSVISLIWGLTNHPRQERAQVLMYHSIGGNAEGDARGLYSVDPNAFRNQISVLGELSRSTETKVVPFGNETPGTISITFDDGYLDNLTIAAPILAEHGLPFHVFLCPTFVESGRSQFLTRRDVLELSSLDQVSLGVHGFSHTPLTRLSKDELLSELSRSRMWLEDLVQKPINSMSYPHGAFNDLVCSSVKNVGFERAGCSKFGSINNFSHPLRVPRIDIWSNDSDTAFTAKIEGKWDWMKWRT